MRRYDLFLLVGDKPCGCSRARHGSCTHGRVKMFKTAGRVYGFDALADAERDLGAVLYHRSRNVHRRRHV